jgi:hypothetical protein
MYVPSSSNELPRKKAARYQQLKMPVTGGDSALVGATLSEDSLRDAESRFSFFWIPAFARMTIL